MTAIKDSKARLQGEVQSHEQVCSVHSLIGFHRHNLNIAEVSKNLKNTLLSSNQAPCPKHHRHVLSDM
jgi:hypothetical protein